MSDAHGHRQFHDEDALANLKQSVTELERRLRELGSGSLRHDVSNTIGAARNALSLLDEDAGSSDPARFVEIAQRNIQQAERLLANESGRNEGNDLGRASERDNGSTFSL
jgi:hypothetical protein